MSGKIKCSNDNKHDWLGQPHLIKNLEKKFGRLVWDVHSLKTPGTPKFLIVWPMEENKKTSTEDQWDYQSGIGNLLYLVKHLHPDLANATRELSKVNDNANTAAYKELLGVIRYVTDMKNLGLKIEPMENSNKPWEIFCLSIALMQETL